MRSQFNFVTPGVTTGFGVVSNARAKSPAQRKHASIQATAIHRFFVIVNPPAYLRIVPKCTLEVKETEGYRCKPTFAGFEKIGSLNCPCDRTGSAQFHFLASVFDVLIAFRNHTSVDQIQQLRSEGLSLSEAAKRSGTTVAVVRR